MTTLRSNSRRAIRTLIGALGGLLGGVGGTLVVTQSGRVAVDLAATITLVAVVAGAAVGFVEPPEWILRLVTVALIVGASAVTVVAVSAPAGAQEPCAIVVSVNGVVHDLGTTSPDDPLVIDVGSEPTIVFEAVAPGVERGLVEVTAASTSPFGNVFAPGDNVLFYEEIDAGVGAGSVAVERSGPTGFRLTGDRYQTPLVPLGLVELDVVVTDLGSGVSVTGCPDTVWVRAVAQPAANRLGQLALASTMIGVLGLAVAGPMRRLAGLGPVETPTSASPPTAPSSGPPISGEPHLQHTESRIVDGNSEQVDPAAPLLAGHEYQLEISFGVGLTPTDDEEHDDEEHDGRLTVAATSRTMGVGASVQIGAPGTPFSIPLTTVRPGRHRVSVDAMHHGHHVQTEQIEFSVVEAGVSGGRPQSSTTLITTSEPSAAALDRLPARQVLVILESDEDGSVDARIRDADGNTIVHYDSPLPAPALDEAARGVRDPLRSMLARGEGNRIQIEPDELAAEFGRVVAAGQRLRMALFPDTRVTEGDVAALRHLVADGAVVQVVGYGAGLGHATLPWTLLYDRPFVERAAGNPMCSSFAVHPVDECPHRSEPQVWCPTGFWGYRSTIEELVTSTVRRVLPTPIASELRPDAIAGARIVTYFEDALSATPTQVHSTQRLGARRLHDFDDVLNWLGSDDSGVELMYVYAHHESGAEGGIRIGEELLSSGTLNAIRPHDSDRWPARPLVIVNACASGAYGSADPVSLVDELRAYGAGGVVAAECALWDPLAGECGLRILDGLGTGRPIGAVLLDLRREMLTVHHNPVGLAYRLQASADTTIGPEGS